MGIAPKIQIAFIWKSFRNVKNDMCITAIGQTSLELWTFKDEQGNPQTSQKMSFSDFPKSSVMLKMT